MTFREVAPSISTSGATKVDVKIGIIRHDLNIVPLFRRNTPNSPALITMISSGSEQCSSAYPRYLTAPASPRDEDKRRVAFPYQGGVRKFRQAPSLCSRRAWNVYGYDFVEFAAFASLFRRLLSDNLIAVVKRLRSKNSILNTIYWLLFCCFPRNKTERRAMTRRCRRVREG